MKHFIRNLLLFFALFCVANIVFNIVLRKVASPYSHNAVYAIKYEYFLKTKSHYNTVFFGSSRTFRHVNPKIIDENLKDLGIRSFNLGSPATFNPEALFLYEDFLKQESPHSTIRYAFVELSEVTRIASVNLFAPRSYYYLNFDYLKFVVRYYFSSNKYNLLEKIASCYPFIQGYILNNILLFDPVERDAEKYYIGENNDGYLPLDVHLKYNKAQDILERNAEFLRDTSVIARANLFKSNFKSKEATNTAYVEFLNQLILTSEKNNIKLYFLIPPRLENQSLLSYLKKNIYKNRVIDLGSYEKYPDLYSAKYFFDSHHLNSLGAKKYSYYLANEIRRIVTVKELREK